MKISTYNLKFLFDTGTRLHSGKEYTFTSDFVEQRFQYFTKQFDLLDADILFLQELGDESALIKILEKTKADYRHFIAEPDTFGVGNAVVYKSRLNCSCSSIPSRTSLPVFNSEDKDTLGSRIRSRRDYVQVETTYNEKPLHLLGIHIKSNFLIYEKDRDGSKIQERLSQTEAADAIIRSEMFRFSQAKKVREMSDSIFKSNPNAQLIILGDFNATTSNKVYSIIRGHMKKLSDALTPILDKVPEDLRFSIVGPAKKRLIDHILISKKLERYIADVEILNKNIYDHSRKLNPQFIVESDHAPIIFELN